MSRRKILKIVVSLMFFFGFLIASFPFIKSFSPNSKAEAELFRLDLSNFEIGKVIIAQPNPYYGNGHMGYSWALMIYKKFNGDVNIWDIPVKENKVGMPDIWWARPSFPCDNFGPTKVNGKVDESLPIKCHESYDNDAWFMKLEWDIDGKIIKGHAHDMQRSLGVIEGKYFVFGKSS